jgi:arginine N-succinyltransferase
MRMLENEGFAFENYVDIFDGGPTMTARTDQVNSIRNARTDTITAIADGTIRALGAAGKCADFRCTFANVGEAEGGVTLNTEAAETLGVGPGDTIQWIAG